MAKQKTFESAEGTTYATSYWRPGQVVIRKTERTAHVTFYGYKDGAAASAGKAPVGELHVQAQPTQFDELFVTAVLEAPGNNVYKSCYELAMAMPNGAAFFDGATDV